VSALAHFEGLLEQSLQANVRNLGDEKIDWCGGIGEDLEKMLGTKKKKLVFLFSATVRIGSGVLRETRGGSSDEASPLAARPKEVSVTSLTHSNIETRMDSPKSVVRVIGGVATIHVTCLFVSKFLHVQNPLLESIRPHLSV